MLGVCYYPEHWPEHMWPDDARRMADLGLKFVRIGEFAWSAVEPRPAAFDWSWLDRAVETLAGAGLKIVMGTPTATPPKWLIDRSTEILPVDERGRRRGFWFAPPLLLFEQDLPRGERPHHPGIR